MPRCDDFSENNGKKERKESVHLEAREMVSAGVRLANAEKTFAINQRKSKKVKTPSAEIYFYWKV
jgi:hypothetical protein